MIVYAIIASAVLALRVDRWLGPMLANKWLPADIWVKALKKSRLIDEEFIVVVAQFNRAMN
jgi:hypothetical protein